MEVWKDKCLKGSRRVARAGELARRIADIVADDEDAEPESVVHTHLCILLAEGDDLDLKRTRMQGTGTPRAGASGGFTPGSSIDAGIPQSMASRNGSMDMGAGVPPRPRDSHESGVGATPDEAGGMTLEVCDPSCRGCVRRSEMVGRAAMKRKASRAEGKNISSTKMKLESTSFGLAFLRGPR